MSNNSSSTIIFFLITIFLIPSVTIALTFNFSNIGTLDIPSINVTGKAYISPDQGIQVTSNERDVELGNNTDGLAFFLAPLNSTLEAWMGGGGLGLGNASVSSSTGYSFVAVEFDTYLNPFDPPYSGSPYVPHVGININSMKSVETAIWNHDVSKGVPSEAWISYTSSSMTLSVDFTINTTKRGNLSYVVDLRDYLPEFVMFGFSAATGDMHEKHNVRSWDFSSILQTAQAQPPSPSPSVSLEPSTTVNNTTEDLAPGPDELVPVGGNKSKKNKGLIIGLSTAGFCMLMILSLLASYGLCRKYKSKKNIGPGNGDGDDSFDSCIDKELEELNGAKKFSYGELVLATDNFAEYKKLGEGGFGGVYRGLLRETNSDIAVKRVSRGSRQGAREYASEVKIISQLRHRNLVQLLGWCHEKGELLLVYEFMTSGSLDSHLFKGLSLLTWQVRYRIARGIASAMFYLHEGWERCVVHRDIKASNVMLDSNFNVKLGDFGLARLVDHEKGSQTTLMAGTLGYLAPECAVTGRASKESDIYSFGILLLEMACGRRAIVVMQENRVLVEWVWSLYGMGQLLDAADPALESNYEAREVEQLLVVGLWCVHPDSAQRPSIRQVIQVVNTESQMPTLPPTMPVASYEYGQ